MGVDKCKFRVLKYDRLTSARAGILEINRYKIKTPALWLGHNLNLDVLPWTYKAIKPAGLFLNAYHIINKPVYRKRVKIEGIRRLLKYNGPIFIDSGGFLFQNSKDMTINPDTIIDLYKQLKPEIGAVLDHPLNPLSSAKDNSKRWATTLRNLKIMLRIKNKIVIMPILHCYDLTNIEKICGQIKKIIPKPKVIGVGSLVPLLKGSYTGNRFFYDFRGQTSQHLKFVLKLLKRVRQEFPNSFLHVFGVGSISTMMLMFSLGVDSVDSVGWRLKAAYGAIQLPGTSDRFLKKRKIADRKRRTLTNNDKEILKKCKCPICCRYNRNSFSNLRKRLENSFESRALHNSYIFTKEINSLRDKINQGVADSFIFQSLRNIPKYFSIFKYLYNENSRGS